jgi:hypothetical protein
MQGLISLPAHPGILSEVRFNIAHLYSVKAFEDRPIILLGLGSSQETVSKPLFNSHLSGEVDRRFLKAPRRGIVSMLKRQDHDAVIAIEASH